MPYKLRISREEVESELRKMGFEDFTDDTVKLIQRDLLRLIKSDLRKLKLVRGESPKTEEYHETEEKEVTDFKRLFNKSEIELEKEERIITEEPREERVEPELKGYKQKGDSKELPSYPEKPDPVNLYHFYKAHWDKFKAPGDDPRQKLRWEIRSKLLSSN